MGAEKPMMCLRTPPRVKSRCADTSALLLPVGRELVVSGPRSFRSGACGNDRIRASDRFGASPRYRYGRRHRACALDPTPASTPFPRASMSVLDRLPVAGDRRVAVRVTNVARRWLESGHPWLFEDSITSVSHEGEADRKSTRLNSSHASIS